jgi:histidine ammonia-lyase
MDRDRELHHDISAVTALVESGAIREAVRSATA